ncbi:MAG: hypothetical protein HY555_00495 [Euryarchaeota archaeon]|nr:hypothetical protein [Euryarchaeota archaeon]
MEPDRLRKKHLLTLGLTLALLPLLYIHTLSNEALATSFTSPLEVYVDLPKLPYLNKTVPAVITVRNKFGEGLRNVYVDIYLFNNSVPYYSSDEAWKKAAIWSKSAFLGNLPPPADKTIDIGIKIEESGYYVLVVYAHSTDLNLDSIGFSDSKHLPLNVTEKHVMAIGQTAPPGICGPTLLLILAMISVAVLRRKLF